MATTIPPVVYKAIEKAGYLNTLEDDIKSVTQTSHPININHHNSKAVRQPLTFRTDRQNRPD